MRSTADAALERARVAEAAAAYERAVRSAIAGPADRFTAWTDEERRLIARAEHADGERTPTGARASLYAARVRSHLVMAMAHDTRAGLPPVVPGGRGSPPRRPSHRRGAAAVVPGGGRGPLVPSSYSPARFKKCTPWVLGDYGVDTLVIAVDGGRTAREQVRRAASSWELVSRGGVRVNVARIDANVVAHSNGTVTVQARLSALLAGDAADRRLMPVACLEQGAVAALALLEELGLTRVSAVRVRRCDLAAELRFPDPAAGLGFMRQVEAAVHLPRYAQVPWKAPGDGRVVGIEWKTPVRRESVLRHYDTGAYRGAKARGELLRLERELRFDRQDQLTPTEFAVLTDLSARFARPFAPLLKAPPQQTVTSRDEAARAVAPLVRRGVVSLPKAENLVGSVALMSGAPDLYASTARNRRLRELRARGLQVDLASSRGEAVDIVAAFAACASRWRPA